MSEVTCTAELGVCRGVKGEFAPARCAEVVCTTDAPVHGDGRNGEPGHRFGDHDLARLRTPARAEGARLSR